MFYSTEPLSLQDIAAGRLSVSARSLYTGETVELSPQVASDERFVGVKFVDGEYSDDPCWCVQYFEGKKNRITFHVNKDGEIPDLTDITLRPAPTMTFLNPRPAPGSPNYPWRYNGDGHSHVIKLPLPLTYAELKEGSQIVVSGVTDSVNVIEGTVEGNLLVFRAGGLLIASVMSFEGPSDLVNIAMQDFTGEIVAVNFDKAYKNLPEINGIEEDENGIVRFETGDNVNIAKCILNGVVIKEVSPYIPSNGLLGNLVFQSRYIRDYGNVIESYYWANGRYLFTLRLNENYKMGIINQDSTNSPLIFPLL